MDERSSVSSRAQSKIANRSASISIHDKQDQAKLFRERRKAREEELLRKQREARLMRSAQATAAHYPSFSASNKPLSAVNGSFQPLVNVKKAPLSVSKSREPATQTTQQRPAAPSVKPRLLELTSKPRKSVGFCTGRIRSSKRKSQEKPINKTKPNSKKAIAPSKVIRHTKASQLRLIRCNPVIEVASFIGKEKLKNYSPLKHLCEAPSTSQLSFLRKSLANNKNHPEKHPKSMKDKSKDVSDGSSSCAEESKPKTPSKIPVKRASFASSVTSPVRTPKPASLREKLREWLESHGRCVDDFKHLSCFGISGSAVKRPQTPYRKTLSTSQLKAIPESKENSPSPEKSLTSESDEDILHLDTTFTIEEENKENILFDPSDRPKKTSAHSETGSSSDEVDLFDKAQGVLSELLKLIKMGYPSDQCELWLRAVRRRFPQCGDEVVYWECMAALEQAKGDFKTALACYERAVSQGGEESVQASLHELRQKLADLNIDVSSGATQSSSRRCRDEGLKCSNIIQSSAIEFFVQEKVTWKKEDNNPNPTPSEKVLTATPVRRSTRSTTSHFLTNGTPKLSCVRSLDVLEPNVRKSLVFRNNSALDPRD